MNGDKVTHGHLCFRAEILEESENLPDPDVLVQEIIEDLEASLEEFCEIATDLGRNEPGD